MSLSFCVEELFGNGEKLVIVNFFLRKMQSRYCKIKKKEPIDYTVRHLNCCVQGACIIASKKFIDVEEKMFTPEPFLYCEELFLYKRCINKGYKIVYEPKIQVWHEDSSTMKRINSGEIEKAKFTLKYHVESRRMLLDYFCKGERIKWL